MTGAGRYAPSPTGDLHLGNLRTALLAWLFARSTERSFLLRVEDLDVARSGSPASQLADLAALGITHDGEIVVQSDRTARYQSVLDDLAARDLVYECFCTRRDIAEASEAAHGLSPDGAYPGTCRSLSPSEVNERRLSRPAALRLRAAVSTRTITDELHGDFTGAVDDLVLRRNDGAFAYNLAVVVDDHDSGVDQVVRGDDLLSSTPRQAHLHDLLGWAVPSYAHVPLALNAEGRRLAKRDGPVTMRELCDGGPFTPGLLVARLGASLGLCEGDSPITPAELIENFDPDSLPREPWVVG